MDYIKLYMAKFKAEGHLCNAFEGDNGGHYVFLTGRRIKSGKHFMDVETNIDLNDYKIYINSIYYYTAYGIADNILHECSIEDMRLIVEDWYNEYKNDERFTGRLGGLWFV